VKIFVLLAGVVLALIPAVAFADDGDPDDLLMKIGGDLHIGAGETAGSVVVIDGNVVIEGKVTKSVFVVGGDALVKGEIAGDLTVIGGDIDLRSTARVDDVTSIRGDVVRASGATIAGDLRERDGFGFLWGFAALFSVLVWVGGTIAVVAAGLVFAAMGGRQLREAAQRMTSDPVNVVIGAVFIAVALPALAVAAMITLVGIPLALAVFLFVLPALLTLGYIVAGARLGEAVLGLASQASAGAHPYAATAFGILLLQLLLLVPVIGFLIASIAALWGAGALAFGAFKAAGGHGVESSTPAAPASRGPQPAA